MHNQSVTGGDFGEPVAVVTTCINPSIRARPAPPYTRTGLARPPLAPTSQNIAKRPYARSPSRSVNAGADFLPALGALLGIENFLTDADQFQSDLDVFIVGDELDGFFQSHVARRDQSDGFVGGRRTHVGLLFFLGDVDVHVVFARIFADDHSFVDFNARPDKHFAALLYSPDGVGD